MSLGAEMRAEAGSADPTAVDEYAELARIGRGMRSRVGEL